MGHLSVVEHLIQKNANIEAKQIDGYTPLLIGNLFRQDF